MALTEVKLPNGLTVKLNDHVYIAPPCSYRDNHPYAIGRVMEFVSPAGRQAAKPARASAKTDASEPPQVRVAFYYRPSDISNRPISDARSLYAAFFQDVRPLSQIRGKCEVRFRESIADLAEYKKLPDRFYYVRFFDPYIKSYYDIVPTRRVQNVPTEILEILRSRYEYIFCEPSLVADLTDAMRGCAVCHKWCSSAESVRCSLCKKHFHMTCLNPPLTSKPGKGYGWTCAPCSRSNDDDGRATPGSRGSTPTPQVQLGKAKETPPVSGAGKPGSKVGRGRASERNGFSAPPDQAKQFKGWPFRYFGQYTDAERTVDPDDSIYPRAATRVGTRYQANVTSWEDTQRTGSSIPAERPAMGPGRPAGSGPGSGKRARDGTSAVAVIEIERGTDTSAEQLFALGDGLPEMLIDSAIAQVRQLPLPIPGHRVEVLDRATRILSATRSATDTLEQMRKTTEKDLKLSKWTPGEIKLFDEGMEFRGCAELAPITRLIPKKKFGEVVRYYYDIWKQKKIKSDLDAELKAKAAASNGNDRRKLRSPSAARRSAAGKEPAPSPSPSDSDDEDSIYGSPPPSAVCASCGTKKSPAWWRTPPSLHGDAMCEDCGLYWRKYGVIPWTRLEDAKRREAEKEKEREGTPTGPGRKPKAAAVPTPPPPPPPAPAPAPPPPPPPKPICHVCKKIEPKTKLVTCAQCSFRTHTGCYGLRPEQNTPSWLCELCSNEKCEETHNNPRCVVCPPPTPAELEKLATADFNLLDVLKPTEGRNWIHMLCSLLVPELQYTDAADLRLVEGVSAVPLSSWTATCTTCGLQSGVCVQCDECQRLYHGSCAFGAGCRIGFEITPIKVDKRPHKQSANPVVVTFKGLTGSMRPVLLCKSHALKGRVLHDVHAYDPDLGETALQLYARVYKQVPVDGSYGLMRKARRLDDAINARSKPAFKRASTHTARSASVDISAGKPCPACASCGTTYSPLFHRAPAPHASSLPGASASDPTRASAPMGRVSLPSPTLHCNACHIIASSSSLSH